MTDIHSILLISKDSKVETFVMSLLNQNFDNVSVVHDANEGKRKLMECPVDIIIVDSGEGEETDTAIDLSDSSSTVILLVPANSFDQISYRVETYGIITVTKPLEVYNFYMMMKVACAVQYKIKSLYATNTRLKEKMEEIRVVNRAKMLLIQNHSMSEQDAHRYIEKEAMDRCEKRIDIAENIIKTYG